MAQTKRKRRTKHRGNAAGSIEARGRTGRKPTESERKTNLRDARQDRRSAEPTWGAAAFRAGFASLMLFVLFQIGIGGTKQSIASSIVLSVLAFALYWPLGYKFDHWLWRRRMLKEGRPIPERKPAAKGKR
jgi:hypothetical protein